MKFCKETKLSALRYVILSDLHLGASHSVLNHVVPGTEESRPDQPSSSLKLFAEALRKTVPILAGKALPKLILLGDVLEMSFADRRTVAMGFLRFIESMFPADQAPVFDSEIILVPGNHDHYLWNSEIDRHYLGRMISVDDGHLPEPQTITRAFAEPTLSSSLLTGLMQRYPHLENGRVVVAYPNYGIVSDDLKRCVVMHHGHYVEPIYRLMTEVAAWVDGVSTSNVSISQLEQENGSWVDFLWSSLGTAGGISTDMLQLYEVMQDTAAMHVATSKLSGRVVHHFREVLPMSGLPDVRALARRLTKTVLNMTLGRASQMERAAYNRYLSESSLQGLRWYLETPLHAQICDDLKDRVPEDRLSQLETTFIFGHTHKPFEEMIPLNPNRFQLPVQVLNTGGWVLDQPRQASTQGAAAVFVDEDLNAASLRLFNNTLTGEDSKVEVRNVTGAIARNPMQSQLATAVDEVHPEWRMFSEQVHDALDSCALMMSKKYFDPEGNPPLSEGIAL